MWFIQVPNGIVQILQQVGFGLDFVQADIEHFGYASGVIQIIDHSVDLVPNRGKGVDRITVKRCPQLLAGNGHD